MYFARSLGIVGRGNPTWQHLQFSAEQFHLSICYCCLRGLQVKHPQLPTMPAMLAKNSQVQLLSLIDPDLLQKTCWDISFMPTPTMCFFAYLACTSASASATAARAAFSASSWVSCENALGLSWVCHTILISCVYAWGIYTVSFNVFRWLIYLRPIIFVYAFVCGHSSIGINMFCHRWIHTRAPCQMLPSEIPSDPLLIWKPLLHCQPDIC